MRSRRDGYSLSGRFGKEEIKQRGKLHKKQSDQQTHVTTSDKNISSLRLFDVFVGYNWG